jgi:hypothetical protein
VKGDLMALSLSIEENASMAGRVELLEHMVKPVVDQRTSAPASNVVLTTQK